MTVPSHSNGFIPRDFGRERQEGAGQILLPPADMGFWPKVVKLYFKMVPAALADLRCGYYRDPELKGTVSAQGRSESIPPRGSPGWLLIPGHLPSVLL